MASKLKKDLLPYLVGVQNYRNCVDTAGLVTIYYPGTVQILDQNHQVLYVDNKISGEKCKKNLKIA